MSDLIGRQAAIDAVTKYAKFLWETYHETCNIAGMIDAIDGVPIASSWRRVEDGLPDLLQFVVVCNDEGKCVVAQYVGYQTDSLTPWRIAYTMYDTDIYDETECGPVRYWMSIPEPPINRKFT